MTTNRKHRADADRMIDAAMALDKGARQLRARAKALRASHSCHQAAAPGSVTDLEWADQDARNAQRHAHIALTGWTCKACGAQLPQETPKDTPAPGHLDSCPYVYDWRVGAEKTAAGAEAGTGKESIQRGGGV